MSSIVVYQGFDMAGFDLSVFAATHTYLNYGYDPLQFANNLGYPTEFFFTQNPPSDAAVSNPTAGIYGGANLNFEPASSTYLGSWTLAKLYTGIVNDEGRNPILLEIDNADVDANDFFKAMHSQTLDDDRAMRDAILTGNDEIYGFTGNDILYGGAGTNFIDGNAGAGSDPDRDIVVLDHLKSESAMSFGADGSVTISDRTDASSQSANVIADIEVLRFGDGSEYAIDQFSNAGRLTAAQWIELAEMYVAYFNRAADAEGLMFWADKFFEGTSLEGIAEYFFDQTETRALYPDPQDTDAFVTAVYENVLGRAPDQDGYDFWVSALESGSVSRGAFVLRIIEGAKADTGNPLDVEYLNEKAELGLFFSAYRGLSDVNDANLVMQLYGGAEERDFAAALSNLQGHYAEALGDPGEMLMDASEVVGVLFDNTYFV